MSIAAQALAAVLLWAGLEKARSPASMAATLRQLGLSEDASLRGVALLASAEVAAAIGLIFLPGSAVTLVGVVVLAAAFAGAGVVALRRTDPVACSCFGPFGRGRLGWSQIIAFPLWGAGALLVRDAVGTASPSFAEAALALVSVGLVLAALRAWPLVGAWRQARADRRSAQEMLVWLPR